SPPTAEIALDAAAVARKRRRDMDMRIGMAILVWKKEPKKRPFSRNVDNYAIPTREDATAQVHPSLGSRLTDHSARSSQSLSVTVMICVAPSIATWPKNCRPSLGGWFGALGAFT